MNISPTEVHLVAMNPFSRQGKAIPSRVRERIVDNCLEAKGLSEIGNALTLTKHYQILYIYILTTSFAMKIMPKQK